MASPQQFHFSNSHPKDVMRRLILQAAASMLAVASFSAPAQDSFPSKPITLIVGFPPGGATDIQARALAQAASKILGQPIIIANKPGMAATLGPASMAETAKPDGYTISVIPGTIFRQPHISPTRYDPLKDFTYIINVTQFTLAITVKSDSPHRTVKDLVDKARKSPGALPYGTTGVGGSAHINIERFSQAAGIKLNMIPYNGGPAVFQAMYAGDIEFNGEAGFGQWIDGGRFRPLAVFGNQRLPNLPDVPTLAELGYKFEPVFSFWGVGGPKGMEPTVVKKLHDAFKRALDDSAFQATLARNYQRVNYESSEEFTATAVRQFRNEEKIAKEFNLTQK